MKKLFSFNKVLALALVLAMLMGAGSVFAEPWSFGVISDTQWTVADDGKNPNTCAADIIKQVDQQFINAHVKLVVHVGDMVDVGSQVNDYTRALYAQDLYNAGIGFYPLRGNHEAAHGGYLNSGADYRHIYPQIVPGPNAGVNNNTPGDITTALIPALDMTLNPPADKTNPNPFTVGTNFSAPDAVNTATDGVSYAFDYNNVTFMLLDQFKSPDYYTSYIPDQQPWIDSTLSSRPANTQAFAFTHKNILGGNHKDNMFGGQLTSADPGDGYGVNVAALSAADQATLAIKQAAENTFLASLQTNNVKYMISGHDHHHYNSVVTSPDGNSKVHQLITASDSSKFYTPGNPVSTNDIPVEQDLARIGYYIFTVDGPRVTIDYYADDHGNWKSDSNFPDGADPLPNGTTPALTFVKRSTTGYSLNGKEVLVGGDPDCAGPLTGGSYAMTDDTTVAETMESGFVGTSMGILAGTNGSCAATNYGKATEKAVNTGWTPETDDHDLASSAHKWSGNPKKRKQFESDDDKLASDILTLWGMADLGSDQTDVYTLSMTYDHKRVRPLHLGSGGFGITTRDEDGDWINAVDMNFGGTKKFVWGAWSPSYKLGTYGLDPHTHTAWAVINYNSDFAVAGFQNHQDQDHRGLE